MGTMGTKVDFPSWLVKEDIAWILSTSLRQFWAIKSLNSIMTWSLSCWNLVFQVRTSYCLRDVFPHVFSKSATSQV